mgnify:CR=1 FL=1
MKPVLVFDMNTPPDAARAASVAAAAKDVRR